MKIQSKKFIYIALSLFLTAVPLPVNAGIEQNISNNEKIENILEIKKPFIEVNFADKNKKINVRDEIKEEAKKQNVILFGSYLDSLEKEAVFARDNGLEKAVLEIPENFNVDSMNLTIEIKKKDFSVHIFQNYNDEELVLFDSKVALGGVCKDYSTGKYRNFSTPSGNFYLKRIVYMPWWHPPKWAAEKRSVKPGRKNPYGLWMSELCKNNSVAGYEFKPIGDARVRIHSTNKPESIGKAVSHSCIRLHPAVAEELFPSLLRYNKHKQGIKNGRGIIYPLENPIPLRIE